MQSGQNGAHQKDSLWWEPAPRSFSTNHPDPDDDPSGTRDNDNTITVRVSDDDQTSPHRLKSKVCREWPGIDMVTANP